jgi:hypothetical protein
MLFSNIAIAGNLAALKQYRMTSDDRERRMKTIKSYFRGIHRIRNLLAALVILVISDGLITHALIKDGLAREANPFLVPLVGTGSFIVIKVVGALISALIIWDIYRHWPKLAVTSSSCLVAAYAGIVLWNLSIFFVSLV